MTKTPILGFEQVISALKRDGWIVLRQKGSHIRLQKTYQEETIKLTIPAHISIKCSTLSHILKQARLSTEKLLYLL